MEMEMEMEIENGAKCKCKCLRSDQKIGHAGCQGADPLRTKGGWSLLALSIKLA